MTYKITQHPFYEALLKDAKRKVRTLENECNRRDARPNSQKYLFEARQELSNLLSQLRHNGYNV